MILPDCDALCRDISARSGNACLLFFSRGKDALGAWLQLRRHFARIVPIYMYLIPGLEFEQHSLDYYSDFFATRIYRLPHPTLYRWISTGTFQARSRREIVGRLGLPSFDYDVLSACVREEEQLPESTYAATGVRISDSLYRRASMKTHGVSNANRRQFFPVWDWDADRLEAELREAKVKLPVDYRLWGRTFDGLDARFLSPLKTHFPRDYARILELFPLADAGLKRMEYRQKWLNPPISTT